jgi:hypothetical protein
MGSVASQGTRPVDVWVIDRIERPSEN